MTRTKKVDVHSTRMELKKFVVEISTPGGSEKGYEIKGFRGVHVYDTYVYLLRCFYVSAYHNGQLNFQFGNFMDWCCVV